MTKEVSEELANTLIATWAVGGVQPDVFAPDATSWHNTDAVDHPQASRRGISERIRSVVPDFRFTDAVLHAWDGGFCVQYIVRGTLPDGSELASPTCMVGTVRDGRISRMQEYVDSAQIQGLRQAVAAGVTKPGMTKPAAG